MNAREEGFLLLTSNLGDPNRHPLTTAQLRTLAERVRGAEHLPEDRQVESRDLMALGYSREMAERIPDSELKIYEKWGHGLYEEATDFQETVLEFLRR